MCGINGITEHNISLIKKMNTSIRHRGPDGENTYSDSNVSLGHVRLSIIDLSPAGTQPMSNEDESIWITFNGEIYNYKELRFELLEKGHIFKSQTDTEVIIHAFEEWGVNCLKRFNGMWAFALYDKRNSKMILSRDRFGVKPLYFHFDNNYLVFSSEIKGVLQYSIERIPNDRLVYEYLALGLLDYSRETFFKDIYKIMPGEILIYDIIDKSIKLMKWYNLNNELESLDRRNSKGISEKLKELLVDCVRYRLIADVPIGSCLSGGLDSSSIVSIAENLTKSDMKVFSMVFKKTGIDESIYVDEIAKKDGIESHKITPTIENLLDDIGDLIWTQEEPFQSLSIYGQYKVMELANKNEIKVLLDGQGADELFAGYFDYFNYFVFDLIKKSDYSSLLNIVRSNKSNDAMGIALFLILYLLGKLNNSRMIIYLLNKKLKFINNFYDGEIAFPPSEKELSLNSALFIDLTRFSIPHLLRYEDKNSMRWGVESRLPFLDYRLVELAMSLEPTDKINKGITKFILRSSMKGIVPSLILERSDKIGFGVPEADWMNSPEFIKFAEKISDSTLFGSRKYWNVNKIKKLIEGVRLSDAFQIRILWRIINIELWLREFIDPDEISLDFIRNN